MTAAVRQKARWSGGGRPSLVTAAVRQIARWPGGGRPSLVTAAIRQIARRPGGGRPSLVTAAIRQIVEEQMQANDETTAYQLHKIFNRKGHSLSIRTVLRFGEAPTTAN